ncbi:MAG: helicase C-terminal domain-containing protein [Cyanobacteria bacterium J06632_3]
MIETEVHQCLRAYLREQGHMQWPHHLTMARLVARALRVGRSALIQIDSLAAYQGTHRLSYLMPALIWPEPAVLALPESILDQVVQQDIPTLQQRLPIIKPVQVGDHWPGNDFRGLLVTSAEAWLRDRINTSQADPTLGDSTVSPSTIPSQITATNTQFPAGIPTLIDGTSELEMWARSQLSVSLSGEDWDALMLAYPSQREFIRNSRVRLTHLIFQHPVNPYSCHLIDEPETALLRELYEVLEDYGDGGRLPAPWRSFWHHFRQTERLAWTQLNRNLGSMVLCCAPTDIQNSLAPVWQSQPVVLMGAALDIDKKARRYRERLGLGEMSCLQFAPDRQHDLVQMYLPDRLPMPNTSHFKAAVLQEIRMLLGTRTTTLLAEENSNGLQIKAERDRPVDRRNAEDIAVQGIQTNRSRTQTEGLNDNHAKAGPTVIVIGDMPLRSQFASVLAAEFGSRVQLESPVADDGVLITGWRYWQANQSQFEPPGLFIVTTLPIPSLEDPLVAGRVATYKRRRQDWFKAYLLPETLSILQRAIAPVRLHAGNGGVIALLDNRVNHRSYGPQILSAMNPAARSNQLDPSWFSLK